MGLRPTQHIHPMSHKEVSQKEDPLFTTQRLSFTPHPKNKNKVREPWGYDRQETNENIRRITNQNPTNLLFCSSA